MAGEIRVAPRFLRYWRVFVDAATVAWLVLFALSFLSDSPLDTQAADRASLGLLAIFVADLGVIYYVSREKPLDFIRHHWFDILLVIPYFRIFRVLRALRLLRLLRATTVMRVTKIVLNCIRGAKKSRRAAKGASSLMEHRRH